MPEVKKGISSRSGKEHPAIAEAMVIGLPDADLGTRAHAIVQRETEAEVSAENPQAFVAERLVAYKLPRTVEFYGPAAP